MSAAGRLREFWRDEQGASAVEYAILASLIAAVIVSTVSLMGQSVANLYKKVMDQVW